MMNEVRQFSAFVDFFARIHDGFGERPWATAEDSDFADVGMLLLNKLEE